MTLMMTKGPSLEVQGSQRLVQQNSAVMTVIMMMTMMKKDDEEKNYVKKLMRKSHCNSLLWG